MFEVDGSHYKKKDVICSELRKLASLDLQQTDTTEVNIECTIHPLSRLLLEEPSNDVEGRIEMPVIKVPFVNDNSCIKLDQPICAAIIKGQLHRGKIIFTTETIIHKINRQPVESN